MFSTIVTWPLTPHNIEFSSPAASLQQRPNSRPHSPFWPALKGTAATICYVHCEFENDLFDLPEDLSSFHLIYSRVIYLNMFQCKAA